MLKSERLGLRAWKESDTEHYIRMNQDPEVMKYFPSLQSPEHSTKTITRFNNYLKEYGVTFFATELLKTQEFIGFIGLVPSPIEEFFTPCIEIGWRLRKEFWGNGYATEGAKACLDFGFNQMKYPEICSFTAVLNKPSENVMRKIGMKRIGNFNHPKVPADSDLCEHVVYLIVNSV